MSALALYCLYLCSNLTVQTGFCHVPIMKKKQHIAGRYGLHRWDLFDVCTHTYVISVPAACYTMYRATISEIAGLMQLSCCTDCEIPDRHRRLPDRRPPDGDEDHKLVVAVLNHARCLLSHTETGCPGKGAGPRAGQHGHVILVIACFQSVCLLARGQKEHSREDNLYKHQMPEP